MSMVPPARSTRVGADDSMITDESEDPFPNKNRTYLVLYELYYRNFNSFRMSHAWRHGGAFVKIYGRYGSGPAILPLKRAVFLGQHVRSRGSVRGNFLDF